MYGMGAQFTVSSKNSWEHPSQLKLGVWKASKKDISPESLSSGTMLT